MFSILIPVYNHATFVGQAVASALRSPLVTEILIVDDGSTDDSPMVISSLAAAHPSRIRNLTASRRENRGAPSRLNELVNAARCEWVAVLNSDDVYMVERFETIVAQQGFSRCDFIFGNFLYVDERGALIGAKRGPFDPGSPFPPSFNVPKMVHSGDFLDLLSHHNYVGTTSNMVFTKTLFKYLGGFAEFRYVHDWDFALRATAIGSPLYVQRYLTNYRLHAANTIRENAAGVNLEAREAFDRFCADFPEKVARPAFRVGMSCNGYLGALTASVVAL